MNADHAKMTPATHEDRNVTTDNQAVDSAVAVLAAAQPRPALEYVVRFRPTGEYWLAPGYGLCENIAAAHRYPDRETAEHWIGKAEGTGLCEAVPASQERAAQPRSEDARDAERFRALQAMLNEPGAAEVDAAIEQDAVRYRWLRTNSRFGAFRSLEMPNGTEREYLAGVNLDAAIDAFIAAGEGGKT